MDIQHMTYFLAVYEAKNFTRAAQTLHITQQGLSKAILRLEEEFGTPLFLRERHALTPTPFGESFYRQVLPLVQDHQRVTAALHREADRQATVRLGVGTNVLPVMDGPALLQAFRTRYPHINLELVHATDQGCESMLTSGQVDVIFSMGPFPASIQTVLLARERIWAVLAQDHPLTHSPSVTVEELSREPIISADPKNKGAEYTRQLFAQAEQPLHLVFQSNDAITNLNLVQAGHGILLVPASVLPMYESAQGICLRPIENSPYREIFLAYEPQALKHTAAAKFIQFVTAARPCEV